MERELVSGVPYVHHMAPMAGGRSIAVASESAYPRLIDLESGVERVLDTTFSNKHNYAVPHPTQNRVVLIGESRQPIRYDEESGVSVAIPVELNGVYDDFAVADNGRLFAANLRPGSDTGADWNRIGLLDVEANCKLYSLFTAGLEPTGVTWLPHSRSLAATLRPQLESDPYMIVWQLSDPAASSVHEADRRH
jgi:hypothetical protein